MPRKSKTDEEIGYLKSAWMEAKEIQGAYGAVLQMYVHPTGRPGVFVFRVVSTPLLESPENPLGSHSLQFEFPNSLRQSLAGALWHYIMKMHDMVQEADEKRKASRSNNH